jgi:two-component system OmpR family response regulator
MKLPKHLLLVDDEEEFATTLAERLELRGIRTLVAHDGKTAIQMAQEHGPFQVVVLDVLMPGIGGLEILRRLREMAPQVPVILLTGQGTTRDGIEGMRQGAFAYLNKPVDLEELLRSLAEALSQQEGNL